MPTMPTPTTLVHSLLTLNDRSPNNPAAIYKRNNKWVEETWQDYYQHVEKIAGGLKSLGLERGQKVGLISNTRYEWALIDIAILACGGVTIPIYPSNTESDIEYILNNSESSFLVLEDNSQLKKWDTIKNNCSFVKKTIAIDSKGTEEVTTLAELEELGDNYRKENPGFLEQEVKQAKVEDIATIIYTSGTTGMPKGVVITHEQIVSELSDVFALLSLSTEDRNLCFLPSSHVFGRVELWGNLYLGFSTGYAQSIETIRADLSEIQPTFLLAVPRIFEKIYNGVLSQAETSPVKHKIFQWAVSVGKKVSKCKLARQPIPLWLVPQYKLATKLVFEKLHKGLGGQLKWAASGSAPLAQEISEFFHAAGILILEAYGLTETTAGIFANTPYDYEFGNVGKPIGDVKVKIADDGEILIQSKKVMKEYYKNPEATAEVIKDGWFHTGDIGELSDDMRLKITDRKKDLIKTAGGKYIAPQKLENMLKLNKYVSNVLIHGDQKKYVVALLTLDQDSVQKFASDENITYTDYPSLTQHEKVQSLIREAIASANSNLASYESIKTFAIIPKEFTIEDGELTPSLKVKRKVCDKKYGEIISGLYGADRSTI